MRWIGEKTEFRFEEATNAETGEKTDLVIEVVTSAWHVPTAVRELCRAMADARGSTNTDDELSKVLIGGYELTQRELERQGALDTLMRTTLTAHVGADVIEQRLRNFVAEADNPHSAAAYVLDAALAQWGFFIGNVRFEQQGQASGVTFVYTVPTTVEELHACLEPWFKQLPAGEGRDAFLEALTAAKSLDGAACRAACVRASKALPKRDDATADTEPPKAST